MRIKSAEVIPIRTPSNGASPNGERTWWVTTPFSHFTAAQDLNKGGHMAAGDDVENIVVRITTEDGLVGLGNVMVGVGPARTIIERNLAPILIGSSIFDRELLWERMFRSTLNFGRRGVAIAAISGVDIALWDLAGLATGQPVFNLLGGRTRERIRCYASQLYATEDLKALASEAADFAGQGFTALKQRFGYGPADGIPGMRKNLELLRVVRDAVGPDVDVAADAYMGWTVSYAIRMIRMIEDAGLHLAWMEEPVLPDNIAGYADIARAVDTPISGGEHEATKYGFRELIDRGAVDIVQLDVNRVGGITEAQKIWAMAAGASLPVLPHAGQSHNYHLIMSHLNSPIAEYFPEMIPPTGYTLFWRIFDGEPVPENGSISLDDHPGLGLTLNEAFLTAQRAV